MKKIWNAETAEVLIYDVIGDVYGYGVTAKHVKAALDEIGAKDLILRINSPGGSVSEASAIYNLFKDHPKNVAVMIDGAAFSSASFLAQVGHTRTMAANAMMMIHDPWTIALGDAAEMRKTADILEKFKDTIVGVYADRSGLDRDEVSKLMTAETWFSADEAKEKGLVDTVSANRKVDNSFDLSRLGFKNAPKEWPPAARTPRLDAARQKLQSVAG